MGLSVRDRLGLAVGLAVGRIIYGMLTIVSSLHSPANCQLSANRIRCPFFQLGGNLGRNAGVFFTFPPILRM